MNNDLKIIIESFITDILNSENNISSKGNKLYDTPLIGYSSGSDKYYKEIKQDIGDFYWSPKEAYKLKYPNKDIADDDLTIISWILPQTEHTKDSMKLEKVYPSFNWVENRLEGEELNNFIKKHLVGFLYKEGYAALAPSDLDEYDYFKSEKYGSASNWSERHAAFVSGLGTFGLCDGLITSKGKAHRCGSIVVNVKLPITKRPYISHTEYCSSYLNGSCKECIERCPAGAISENGHDKTKCRNYQKQIIKPYITKKHHLTSTSCGLCQTGVPCESGIPEK